MPDDDSGPAATCCGQKYCGASNPAQVGKPLAPTCQLCPASLSYWRKQELLASDATGKR